MKKLLMTILVTVLFIPSIPTRGIDVSIVISSDHYGNIFVLNTKTQTVSRFDKRYNFEATVLDGSKISKMTGLAVCWCAGEIALVSSGNGASKLFEYESKNSYKYLRQVIGPGSDTGKIKNPTDVCYLRSDDTYWLAIVDNDQKKVVVVDEYGKLSKEVTGLVDPKASYFSSFKKLYIIDDGQVKTANRDDKKATGSFGKGQLANPSAIVASENEDMIFVLDGSTVKTFSSTGAFLRQFGSVPQAVSMTVNIGSSEVVVASNADSGSLYAYSYTGTQKSITKNVLNPSKQTVLKFTVGSYVYQVGSDKKALSCPVRIENGRSLVPVRQVVEPLGGKVVWDAGVQKITIIYGNPKKIELTIGDKYAYVDGKKTLLPSSVPPRIYCNGTTMVPLKFVSDILGAQVQYYEDSKTIEVKK